MFGLTVQVAPVDTTDARVTVRLGGSAKQRSHRSVKFHDQWESGPLTTASDVSLVTPY